MKLEITKILEGVRNHLIPPKHLKELIRQTAEGRLAICKECPFNSTTGEISAFSKCNACGCFLELKAKSLSSNCGIERFNELNQGNPIPLKWAAIASQAENDQAQEITKDI